MNILKTKKLAIIGYGNPHRQDDRVGHIIANDIQDWVEMKALDNVKVVTGYQIDIDMIEDIHDTDLVIFIDAHLPDFSQKISYNKVEHGLEAGFTTHAFDAGDLLAVCNSVYHSCPKGYILSIPGFAFDMTQKLSAQTALLVPPAIEIMKLKINAFFEKG